MNWNLFIIACTILTYFIIMLSFTNSKYVKQYNLAEQVSIHYAIAVVLSIICMFILSVVN